jgi:hypothetical protein
MTAAYQAQPENDAVCRPGFDRVSPGFQTNDKRSNRSVADFDVFAEALHFV